MQDCFAQFLFSVHHLDYVVVRDGGDLEAQLGGRRSYLADEFVVRENAESVQLRVMLNTFAPLLQPVGRSKVDGFGEVVALVEARVIGARERDDKFTRVLVQTVNWNSSVHQRIGIHYGNQLVQQIRLTCKDTS